MAVVHVETEQDAANGWTFRVRIERAHAPDSLHEVALSWVDYEFWSGGTAPPADVAAAVVRFLLEQPGEDPPPQRFDASTIRRRHPDLDDRIGAWLR